MKKKNIVIIIIIIIAILAIVMSLGRNKTSPEVVRIKEAVTGDIQSWLSTNALIESNHVKNYFGTSGLKVKTIHVEVGDNIGNGDVILEYDVTDLENALRQAEIQYDNALLNRKELINQKEQIEEDMADLEAEILRLDGSADPQDIANMQALIQKREAMQTISDERIKLMDNSVALAKLGLDSARSRLDDVKDGMVSDMDGTVTALSAEENIPLGMTQPAVVVQDLVNLKGIIQLGKYDAAKINVGQKAIIEYSDYTYEGMVSLVNPAASRNMATQESSLRAEIDINNANDLLRVDFDVNVDILIGEVKDVLKLPVECIRYDKAYNTSVFVIDNGKAKLTSLTLGLQSETEVEVLEGIKQGDRVILNPSISIEDGTPVVEEGAEP